MLDTRTIKISSRWVDGIPEIALAAVPNFHSLTHQVKCPPGYMELFKIYFPKTLSTVFTNVSSSSWEIR